MNMAIFATFQRSQSSFLLNLVSIFDCVVISSEKMSNPSANEDDEWEKVELSLDSMKLVSIIVPVSTLSNVVR